ncbi:Putative Holin-X, holin superfamily III [Leifsonia sp. 98AMF]|uniref:phage holin family protein n=1 Tax=unclassified Leifsonia TaxID=2663824 RepID=UPI00087AE29C|nr:MULTISPECIES: phage holin family protein [unclassified Leifsonia]SDG99716.1 Putative Holin-X, holin superfamily III [Leifsonia sp. 197AMF]SDJ41718.1 Putative Holin-X, holin superfamily III [Leifsonia sp. 466MF]SDK35355.1 Putative Holin-X, holin superfamily III [Leifsonia sp. 157MF]SDN62202.1 Putative Holin-X, holin superfamily III [Leifsonia sp. 509MF]SEN46843.1 Putative Holin-X, holin superfamily III [Leifsonia sp. 467MF]
MTDQPTPSEQQAANSSLGELLGEVSRDLSTLIRQEMELAKAEIKQTVTRAGKGAGLLGGAGYAGLMAVFFLSIALWWALGYLVGNAWSAVIVAVIWGVVALILYLRGRKQLETVKGAPQTVETVNEFPETLKRNEENR